MGVDYYSCSNCSETFPDCGYYGNCKCENILCGPCFKEFKLKYGTEETYDYGEVSKFCDDCSLENPSDNKILNYLLKSLNKTKESVVKEMQLNILN